MTHHLPDCSMPDGAEPCKGFLEVQEERDRLQATFDLRWKADMRAIKRWQDAHPGKELTWPDHADLVVWLLEQLEKVKSLPPLNDELVAILGRPCFACIGIANAFREAGYTIKGKAENEQAFVAHWALNHYLSDPERWRENTTAELKQMAATAKAKQEGASP